MPLQSDDTVRFKGRPVQCPHCGYYCHPHDEHCPNCNTELNPSQVDTSDMTEATLHALKNPHRPQVINTPGPEGLIILQIVPSHLCIPLSLNTPVILGRAMSPEDRAIIDLTSFQARELGVSRHHCQLRRDADRVIAVDLDSSNYSYINNMRMIPDQEYVLAHRDKLILGRLYLNVLFSLALEA